MRGRAHSARAALIGAAVPGARRGARCSPADRRRRRCSPPRRARPRTRKTDTLYKIVFVHRPGGDRPRLGGPLLLAVPVPGAAGGSRRRRPDPRQHRARARLDDRRQRDRGRDHDHHLHLPARHPGPGPVRARRRSPRRAARTPPSTSLRRPTARRIEIQVSGQQYLWRYQYPNGDVLLPGDGRAPRHDRDADDQGQRRRPLLVDPGARRQVRRRPGLHERDLVQGHRERHLRGPVRRVLRRQPPLHDGEGQGRRSRGYQALGRAPEAADRRGPEAGAGATQGSIEARDRSGEQART